MYVRILAAIAALAVLVPAHARSRCDGFHGCRCGVTQARHFGFPLNFHGFNLKLAHDWTRAFQRTTAQPGAVVFQWRRGGGHVSRIVSLETKCLAVVSDDAGQYSRNICARGAIYVDPGQPIGKIKTARATQSDLNEVALR